MTLSTPFHFVRAGLAGATVALGLIVTSSASDQATFRSLDVGATPESVTRGFDGKLFVTLMGTKRALGDGDGKVVVVDGDKVSDFTTGLDDPKGLVFTGGRLITADFDKVWSIDESGTKTLLAGPDAFPIPPLYLNDVVVEKDGASVLVTDMGNVGGMFSGPKVMWPLDSDEARSHAPLGRVYRISLDGRVLLVIDHAPEITNPNGIDLLPDGTILLGEFFRGHLMAWKAGTWTKLTDENRGLDGIVHTADAADVYITEVFSGRVWHVTRATGEKHLLATLQSAADLLLENDTLIVPDSAAGKLVWIPAAK